SSDARSTGTIDRETPGWRSATSAAVVYARAGSRVAITTLAPAAARARVVSRPSPLPAPVTTATVPVRSGMSRSVHAIGHLLVRNRGRPRRPARRRGRSSSLSDRQPGAPLLRGPTGPSGHESSLGPRPHRAVSRPRRRPAHRAAPAAAGSPGRVAPSPAGATARARPGPRHRRARAPTALPQELLLAGAGGGDLARRDPSEVEVRAQPGGRVGGKVVVHPRVGGDLPGPGRQAPP